MRYDPERHHRRSIRLKGYDYHLAGAYFVTIVTQDRAFLFGGVIDGVMCLNDAGHVVQTLWDEIPIVYPGVNVDAVVVMPNHVHGIIILNGDVGAGPYARPVITDATTAEGHPRGRPEGHPRGDAPTYPAGRDASDVGAGPRARPPVGHGLSLADVIGRFKSLTTRRYTDGVRQSGWLPYRGRLWQRDYYEHIIRDEASLQRIRAYISANPSRWTSDAENPDAALRDTRR